MYFPFFIPYLLHYLRVKQKNLSKLMGEKFKNLHKNFPLIIFKLPTAVSANICEKKILRRKIQFLIYEIFSNR